MTERGWYERDHKTFRETINWASRNHFLFPWWKGVLGACSGPKWPPTAPLEHPEKVLSFKKEAERGWKSGARSLSWKSDWKPSISRSFCAIGTYCIFFRLEVTAVWKKKCRYKQISFTKSLLLLKGHFQSSFIIPFQCSITYVEGAIIVMLWPNMNAKIYTGPTWDKSLAR